MKALLQKLIGQAPEPEMSAIVSSTMRMPRKPFGMPEHGIQNDYSAVLSGSTDIIVEEIDFDPALFGMTR